MNASWIDDNVTYQIYPLGLCGAPRENSWDWSNTWNGATAPVKRIERIYSWVDHIKKLGCTSVMFNPILQSDSHGYNIRDFYTTDSRLGCNEDLSNLCQILHENKIRVILDVVFIFVGRGFWAFRDVQTNREKSAFIDWFKGIDFSGNTPMNDGFAYEGWNGNYEEVMLNMENPDLCNHIFGALNKWVEFFRIDGLRLGCSYAITPEFLERLRNFCNITPAGNGGHIALIGEIVNSSDYRNLVNPKYLHAATNYECYRSIFTSFNTKNLFEIAFSLNRQFGEEGVYQKTTLLSFVDNHDVSRFASAVNEERLLPLGYGILFGMPGSPSIYYGSEWGAKGQKENGDWELRPSFENPEWNELTETITKLLNLRKTSPALRFGDYRQIFIANEQFMFERTSCGEDIFVAVNISEYDYNIVEQAGTGYGAFEGLRGNFVDLITGTEYYFQGNVDLPPCSVLYLKRK